MGLSIDKKIARRRLQEALVIARSDAALPQEWVERTERIGSFQYKTCLVALGTALLATATDDTVDALTLKSRAGNKAYSARTLAHEVLVPASVAESFDLRTTGREPLNNQPFFHSDRVDRMPDVKYPDEIKILVECLEHVHYLRTDEALMALAAFLRSRIAVAESAIRIDLGQTSSDLQRIRDACVQFLGGSAESGKRAQALVAAAFDLVFDDVRTARVFDPSRRLPGDVQAFYKLDPVVAVEVRAKAVTYSDAVHFVRAAGIKGFPHAVIAGFEHIDPQVIALAHAAFGENGVLVSVYPAYSDMLFDAFSWARRPLQQLLDEFPRYVVARLREMEVRDASLATWGELLA